MQGEKSDNSFQIANDAELILNEFHASYGDLAKGGYVVIDDFSKTKKDLKKGDKVFRHFVNNNMSYEIKGRFLIHQKQ